MKIIDAIIDPIIYERWVSLQPTITAKLKKKSERDASFKVYLESYANDEEGKK